MPRSVVIDDQDARGNAVDGNAAGGPGQGETEEGAERWNQHLELFLWTPQSVCPPLDLHGKRPCLVRRNYGVPFGDLVYYRCVVVNTMSTQSRARSGRASKRGNDVCALQITLASRSGMRDQD